MHAIFCTAREHQAGKEGGVGRPRGELPLQVRSPPHQWRAADLYALLLTLSRRPRPRDRGVAASAFFLPLFTEPPRRWILRSWYAGWRIAPLAGHPIVGLRVLGSSRSTTVCCTCASLCAHVDAWHHVRIPTIRGVVRSLGPRVDYRRYGLPDTGVCTRRYEGRY